MPDYQYTKVNDRQKFDLAHLAKMFQEIEIFIEHHAEPGRRRSIAITNLEQAAMWAAKAIAKPEPGTEQPAPPSPPPPPLPLPPPPPPLPPQVTEQIDAPNAPNAPWRNSFGAHYTPKYYYRDYWPTRTSLASMMAAARRSASSRLASALWP